jgi:hypothetical protein
MQVRLREIRDQPEYQDFIKFNILSLSNSKLPVPLLTITEKVETYLDYYEELKMQ